MSNVTQDRPTLSPWNLGPQQTLPELSPERRRYEVALRERARRLLPSTRQDSMFSAAMKAQPAAVKAQPAAVKAQPA
ncbi:MAG: hypothetical protein VYD19_05320, partial [Myxococcota bacterium]|nr:hypothetical protein [Myxococcota bacterium]